jgi:multiple sugar transport system ATP-binding protein
MTSLKVQSVTKRFGSTRALSQVDLRVEDGEFCVLLGPSGCGKSTLLNIIAGLVPQDRGTVRLDGRAIDHLAPRDRDIAMVFQSYALYPHMTVAENLSFGLRMRRMPRNVIRERVLWAAELLGITELLERKPRELSGGQRQRVAMGRALVRRPHLFLLDEPLSNLDARLRAKVRLELKELHRQIKGTIIYVTHDQVEAMTLGDKVVVMRAGRIHQIGSPDTVYRFPQDTFVARFIGSPEMNLFEGRIRQAGGGTLFRGRGFGLELPGLSLDAAEAEIELGFRPEDIVTAGEAESGLPAHVEMITNIGSEKYLILRLGEEKVTARVSKERDHGPGEAVSIRIPEDRVHIFRDGRRLTRI